MTTLLDTTIQHVGWAGPTFPQAGWFDWRPFTVLGLAARSCFVQALNGIPLDQAIRFSVTIDDQSMPLWFNFHDNKPLSLETVPSPFLVTTGLGITVYTRVPHSNDAINYRVVVSDQPITPNPSTPPCEYGTQTRSSAPDAIVITQPLIDEVLEAVGIPALGVVFGAIIGVALNILELCDQQPPVMPTLNSNLFANSPADVLTAFRAVAWPYFCQCVPGTPAPINFPLPVFVPPAGWPAAPTFSCNPDDICSSLVRLEQLLNQVAGTVANAYNVTTIMQRYGVPFEVVPGALHTNLSGVGELTFPRTLGVGIEVVSKPPTIVAYPGVPPYQRDLGWVGYTTPSGALEEHRVTRDSELWLPPEARMANRFGWNLKPGVVLNVRELYAEA